MMVDETAVRALDPTALRLLRCRMDLAQVEQLIATLPIARVTEMAIETHRFLREQDYLTAPQAAVYLAKPSTKAFRTWAAKEILVPCRAGRSVTWLRTDLDDAVQSEKRRAERERAKRQNVGA